AKKIQCHPRQAATKTLQGFEMPGTPSRLPSRSWRPGAKPAEQPTATGPTWRRVATASASRAARRSRAFRVVLILLAFLTLSSLFVWVCLWLAPPKPACLVLIGAGYEDNLAIPLNVYGRQSMQALQ